MSIFHHKTIFGRGLMWHLDRYFSSGWVPLIPYLACYSVYWWADGAVSRDNAVPLPARGLSLLSAFSIISALQAVLLLAWCARAWVRSRVRGGNCLFSAIPWLGITALIAIPGVYLEFPADPLVHLGRIQEWSHAATVGAHSASKKFSYFLAYSIVGPSDASYYWIKLNLFYVVSTLLLCRQYQRLSETMALPRPATFIFIALQLLIDGNSAFSFHRYYGLSSTIFAKIAVVAIWCTWIKFISSGFNWTRCGVAALSLIGLFFLVIFNHVQGLLWAFIGIASASIWRANRTQRNLLIPFLLAILLAGGVVLGGSHISPAVGKLVENGWLNSVYSFDVWHSDSPAANRFWELSGTFGILTFVLGLLMLRRNELGGWLVTLPWALLIYPPTAILLALYLDGDIAPWMSSFHGSGPDYLTVFSRQMMAIPFALPFAWLTTVKPPTCLKGISPTAIPLLVILGQLCLPGGFPAFDRVWQALAIPPDDLALRPVLHHARFLDQVARHNPETKVICRSGFGFVLEQMGVPGVPYSKKQIQYPELRPPAQDTARLNWYQAGYVTQRPILVVLPNPNLLYTPYSQAAAVSQHWLRQEVALNFAGFSEMKEMSEQVGFQAVFDHEDILTLINRPVPDIAPATTGEQSN